MKFLNPDADVFVPGPAGLTAERALERTTHLCVGAHQDDIEIMAYAGLAACLEGSPSRRGIHEGYGIARHHL